MSEQLWMPSRLQLLITVIALKTPAAGSTSRIERFTTTKLSAAAAPGKNYNYKSRSIFPTPVALLRVELGTEHRPRFSFDAGKAAVTRVRIVRLKTLGELTLLLLILTLILQPNGVALHRYLNR
jgi:hypothetical protein